MKPGYKTTEFYLAVAQQILAALVIFGVIQPQDMGTVQDMVTKDILAVATLVVSLAPVYQYIQARLALKKGQENP